MKLSNEEIGNFVVTEVQVEGMLGPKGEQGDKGEPFTYEDFTEQQLAPLNELKNQAQTAANTATNAASTATQASLTTQKLTDEVLNMKTDIQKVAENRVAITAVSLIKDQIVNVSETSDDIKTISKDLANVDTVAGDIASVKTVATNIKNVNTVATADAQVKTVAGLDTQIKLIGNNKAGIEALYKTLNMTAAATTLPAGSNATVTQEATDTGFTVTFGIPKGDKGDTGAFDTDTAYAFTQPISFNGGTTSDSAYSLFSKYRIQIGSNSTSTYTGVITWRNCGAALGVVGAGFYVNSNGTAKFVHKSGYNSTKDDAVLSFDSSGLYFATAPDGTIGANLGNKVLTVAGGKITGELTLDEGMTLKKGFKLDGDVSTFDFGYNWDDGTGPGFAMRGASYTGSDDGPGSFVFWARKDKSGQVKLIGSPNGNLSWNGYNVETVFSQTKGTSAPSAWKQHTISGLLQQGGYLAIADVGEKITFPTAYKHTPTVILNYIDPTNPAPSWLKSVDTTGFTPATSSETATGLVWTAIGFA